MTYKSQLLIRMLFTCDACNRALKKISRVCCVFSVPGHAKSILKFNPATSEISYIGGGLNGKFKWLRGVPIGDSIYCVPSNANRVLKINVKSQTCKQIGPVFPGKWKWHGECVLRSAIKN